jgi:hypothetical protein
MGAVNFSIDVSFVEELKRLLPLAVFVETGTFEGETVAMMAPLFGEIHTIEVSDAYYRAAAERFGQNADITVYHDDSPRALESLRADLENRSVLYWLDAHWCLAADTGGAHSESPLLAELDAIGHLNTESVLMIDDARLFLCTPPQPAELGGWPRFQAVIERLFRLSAQHDTMVINDVIVLYPRSVAEPVAQYAGSHSIDWLAALRELDESRAEIEMLHETAAERLALIEELHGILALQREGGGA